LKKYEKSFDYRTKKAYMLNFELMFYTRRNIMAGQKKSTPNRPMRDERSYPDKRRDEQYNTKMDKGEKEGKRLEHVNKDRGPPMMFGEHHFDKGYESDADVFKREESWPGDEQRGNEYVTMNREIVTRDSKALERDRFSKIH
jgi:hypothetical protein